MTRTCANPACQVTFEPVSSWSPKRFCCYDCAHDAHRGTTHAPWKRYRETVSPGGWCVTCDFCEQGFAEGDVVRQVRVSNNGYQSDLLIHRCCWDGWNKDRLATCKFSACGIQHWSRHEPIQKAGAV